MQQINPNEAEQSSSTKDVDECLRLFIGYRLKRAYTTIRGDIKRLLVPLGLQITTFSTLQIVVHNPGLRQSTIAAALDIERSNMVALVDELEGKKLLRRDRASTDRRAYALTATAAGVLTCEKATAVISGYENKILGSADDINIDSLVSALAYIEAGIEEQ